MSLQDEGIFAPREYGRENQVLSVAYDQNTSKHRGFFGLDGRSQMK